MASPRILLIIGGGIAAYKACELVRLIRKGGGEVTCVLTDAGAQFITPMTLAALSGARVHTSLWDAGDEAEIGHIELSRAADLVVICPATADLLAKMAAGIADDLASTLLLATDKRVLAAPAMNVRMWLHPATQRNVAQLRADGVEVMAPDEGSMACGEFGPGRLPEPARIHEAIMTMLEGSAPCGRAILSGPISGTISGPNSTPADPLEGQPGFERRPAHRPLYGRHVLVTAGPTHERIDPVRYLANRSSGKQGFAIAAAAAEAGARVTLVAGPVHLETPPGVERVDVESASEMAEAVEEALPVDCAIMVAAVADWRAGEPVDRKLKKSASGPPQLVLAENPDILANLAARPDRPRLVIGFAAETNDLLANAEAKRQRKGADWIVANDVSTDSQGVSVMGGEENEVHLLRAEGATRWERMDKHQVARRLIEEVAREFASDTAGDGGNGGS